MTYPKSKVIKSSLNIRTSFISDLKWRPLDFHTNISKVSTVGCPDLNRPKCKKIKSGFDLIFELIPS